MESNLKFEKIPNVVPTTKYFKILKNISLNFALFGMKSNRLYTIRFSRPAKPAEQVLETTTKDTFFGVHTEII